jgi:hypothetical protein
MTLLFTDRLGIVTLRVCGTQAIGVRIPVHRFFCLQQVQHGPEITHWQIL